MQRSRKGPVSSSGGVVPELAERSTSSGATSLVSVLARILESSRDPRGLVFEERPA